jgi:hypothetical protein
MHLGGASSRGGLLLGVMLRPGLCDSTRGVGVWTLSFENGRGRHAECSSRAGATSGEDGRDAQ